MTFLGCNSPNVVVSNSPQNCIKLSKKMFSPKDGWCLTPADLKFNILCAAQRRSSFGSTHPSMLFSTRPKNNVLNSPRMMLSIHPRMVKNTFRPQNPKFHAQRLVFTSDQMPFSAFDTNRFQFDI